MGTFQSKSGEQLNTCWSFISSEYEVENRLSWITKIEPELMMEVSLVLSVRQLHDGQNHLLSESKISGFRHLEKEELMLGDNGIVRMSNFSSLAEKQKHWLKEALILMVFEIKSLASTEVLFSSSMTKCSISAVSCWEFLIDPKCYVNVKVEEADLDQHKSSSLINIYYNIALSDLQGLPDKTTSKTISNKLLLFQRFLSNTVYTAKCISSRA